MRLIKVILNVIKIKYYQILLGIKMKASWDTWKSILFLDWRFVFLENRSNYKKEVNGEILGSPLMAQERREGSHQYKSLILLGIAYTWNSPYIDSCEKAIGSFFCSFKREAVMFRIRENFSPELQIILHKRLKVVARNLDHNQKIIFQKR